MNPQTRKIDQSPLYQGVDEVIAYTLTTTPWVSTPTSPTVVMKDTAGTDVTSTYLSGTASVSGDVITTPTVTSLVAGTTYLLEIKWVVSGNTFEAFADVIGQV